MLSYGLRNLTQESLEPIRVKASRVLAATNATAFITDYAPGWGEFSANLAVSLGLPLVGAAPFPSPLSQNYRRRARSSIVFNDTFDDFFEDPTSYLAWIQENVDLAITYFPPDDSSYFHRVVLKLGIETISLY